MDFILSRLGSHWKTSSKDTALCHPWWNSSKLAARWERDFREARGMVQGQLWEPRQEMNTVV